MQDISRNIFNSCPWVYEGAWDNFWAFFRFSELFLTFSMWGISLWNKNIHIATVSFGITLNNLSSSFYQRFYGLKSPFYGCGDYLSTPSGFSQEVSFFYCLFFGYLYLRKYLVKRAILYLVSIWSVMTIYSLLYFPFNTHFQVVFGVLIGTLQGALYLLLIICFLYNILEEIQRKLDNEEYFDAMLFIKNKFIK